MEQRNMNDGVKSYNYVNIASQNSGFTITEGSTSTQTVVIPAGFVNLFRSILTFNATQSAPGAGLFNIYPVDTFSWISQLTIRHDSQILVQIQDFAQWLKQVAPFKKRTSCATRHYFKKRQTKFAAPVYKSGTTTEISNVNLRNVGDYMTINNLIGTDPAANKFTTSYLYPQGTSYRQFSVLDQTAANQAKKNKIQITLGDLLPFTLCEIDTDLYFPRGLVVEIVYNPYLDIAFTCSFGSEPATNNATRLVLQNPTLAAGGGVTNAILVAGKNITVSDHQIMIAQPRDMDFSKLQKELPIYFPYIRSSTSSNGTERIPPFSQGVMLSYQFLSFFSPSNGLKLDKLNNSNLLYNDANNRITSGFQIQIDNQNILQGVGGDDLQLRSLIEQNWPYHRKPELDIDDVQYYNFVVAFDYTGGREYSGKTSQFERSLTFSGQLHGAEGNKYLLTSVHVRIMSYDEQGNIMIQ